jgi:transcription initiation factor TFIIH subunit 2
MADSDGEYVEDGSDDDFLDHQVTTSSHDPSSSSRRAAAAGAAASTGASNSAGGPPSRRTRRGAQRKAPSRAAWEDVKRSWETVVEDPDGSLALSGLLDAELRRRRRLLQDTTPLQRGIIRHLVLVLDQSLAMLERDMLPNRHRRVAQHAATFVREFFEQNPISQLGIVGMRDGVAVRISDMGGNPAEHLERLKEAEAQDPQGNPSLQNALEMCRGALLYDVPLALASLFMLAPLGCPRTKHAC